MGLKAKWKTALAALAAAGALTLLAGLGVLTGPDRTVSDALYQSRQPFDGNIVLVGIDQRALEEIGPYNQWGRDVAAMAVDALNQSEDCRPAVIALDILFSGETDPGKDLRLAEAAGRYGNVIVGSAASLGASLVEDGDTRYYFDNFTILGFEEPFEALRDVTVQGHINAMLDNDGVLRHHLLQIMLPDGTAVPSMALAAAQMYRGYKGQGAVELPPTDSRGPYPADVRCGVPGQRRPGPPPGGVQAGSARCRTAGIPVFPAAGRLHRVLAQADVDRHGPLAGFERRLAAGLLRGI